MRRAALLFALALPACATRASQAPQQDPFVRVFHALRPSVVLFTMQIPSDDPKKKGSWDDAYAQHVIDGARNLRVTIGDRRKVPARTIAADEKTDLALVQTDAKDLPPVALGTSTGLQPGMAIGVAGYPIPDAFQDEGLGTSTSVFAGRISSIRHDALELDVPVIPGESGGPVFDAATGAVLGLAESRFEEEKAIGFAIPIDDAKRFMAHVKGSRVAIPGTEATKT